jgi:hypothetical protein
MGPQDSDPKTPVFGVIAVSLGIVLTLIFFIRIFEGVGWEHITREFITHEKITSVHSRGFWSAGEYRECHSLNTKEEDADPQLWCGDSSPMDGAKVFKVKFSGDLTYDKDKKEGEVHYWWC